jgi:hypothetical protein
MYENHYKEEFHVPQDLLGLVIGVKGQNLQAARKIEGITQLHIDDSASLVRIIGEVCTIAMPLLPGPMYIHIPCISVTMVTCTLSACYQGICILCVCCHVSILYSPRLLLL